MADESPAEREERLQKAEDRLQRAKERHKEEAAVPERTRGGGGFGKAVAGIGSFFGEHKIIILAVVGFGIVAYIIYKSQSGATTANTANQQGSLAGNQDANTASALDSLQTQLNNLAATVSNIPAGPTGPAGPPGPSGPGGTGGSSGGSGGGSGNATPSWWKPLLGSAPESSLAWGQTITVNGTKYLTGWGADNRLWGVPFKPGMTQAQWYNVPIGGGVGQKVLISDQPPQPTLHPLNSMANHSPIYNFMKLAPEAVPGTDLSHSAVAFGPKNIRPIGFPNARAS